MDNYQSNISEPSIILSQLPKYLYRDGKTGMAVCKLCKKPVRDSTYLKIHLEKVHRVHFDEVAEQSIIDGLNYPQARTIGTAKSSNKSKLGRSANISGSTANQTHDWLSPFLQQISQPSSDQVDEQKQQVKYLINCTQFTQPLKYFQFNRYLDQQINQIKQQLSQLTCLRKIPATVMLEEKDVQGQGLGLGLGGEGKEKKYDRYGIEELRGYLDGRMVIVREMYDLVEWRASEEQKDQVQEPQDFHQANKNDKQHTINPYLTLLTQTTTHPKSPHHHLQHLQTHNYKITQITTPKKQNIPPQHPSAQNPTNKPDNNDAQVSEIYVMTHPCFGEVYGKYGDGLAVVGILAAGGGGGGEVGVVVFGVENWRVQFMVVGVLVITNLSNLSADMLQSALLSYLHTMNTALPKSITILQTTPIPHLHQSLTNILTNLPQTTPKPTLQIPYLPSKTHPNPTPQPQPRQQHQQQHQQADKIYGQFVERVGGIVQKYRMKGLVFDFQVIRGMGSEGEKDGEKEFYLGSGTGGIMGYRGLFESRDRLEACANLIQNIKERIANQTDIAAILCDVLKVFQQNYHNEVAQQMEIAATLDNSTDVCQLKIPKQHLSPKITQTLQKIHKKTTQITHLKHQTPTTIQTYSAMPSPSPSSSLISKCRLFKNTTCYMEYHNSWYCNCNKIYEIGLPCFHVMKILEKTGGSLLYYVGDRWWPTQEEIEIMRQDWSKFGEVQEEGEGEVQGGVQSEVQDQVGVDGEIL